MDHKGYIAFGNRALSNQHMEVKAMTHRVNNIILDIRAMDKPATDQRAMEHKGIFNLHLDIQLLGNMHINRSSLSYTDDDLHVNLGFK